jgi:AcrR family transcriptional regulator
MAREKTARKKRRQVVDLASINRVATRLFRQNGYDSTTMQDIADELGILKGSLYHHIDNKEQLLLTILRQSVGDVSAAVAEVERSPLPPPEKLRRLVRTEVLTMIQHQDEILIWLTERGRNPGLSKHIEPGARQADNKLRTVLEDGAAAGNWPISNLGLAYQAIRGMMAWVPAWYRPTGRQTAEEIADIFADYALRVLRGNGGSDGPRAH